MNGRGIGVMQFYNSIPLPFIPLPSFWFFSPSFPSRSILQIRDKSFLPGA